MATRTTVKSRPVPDRDELVAELAKVLSNPGAHPWPRIIWNPLASLGKLDIIVIWDRWRGLPFRDRTALILEACGRYKAGLREQVYTAIGQTPEEAISLGYLPFRIAVAAHRVAAKDRERIDKALIELGAVETSEGLQLRFESFDEAQDAFARLAKGVPGPYWSIVEEVARES